MVVLNRKVLVVGSLCFLTLVSAGHAAAQTASNPTSDSTDITTPTLNNMNRVIVIDTSTCGPVNSTGTMRINAKDHTTKKSYNTGSATTLCASGYLPVKIGGTLKVRQIHQEDGVKILREVSLVNTLQCCKISYTWQ